MTFSFPYFRRRKPVFLDGLKRLRVLFHREARGLRSHGAMAVSHADYGLDNEVIRFNFLGLSVPPALTIEVMRHLIEELETQGYVFHQLVSYGTVIYPNPTASVTDLIQEQAARGIALPGIAKQTPSGQVAA